MFLNVSLSSQQDTEKWGKNKRGERTSDGWVGGGSQLIIHLIFRDVLGVYHHTVTHTCLESTGISHHNQDMNLHNYTKMSSHSNG